MLPLSYCIWIFYPCVPNFPLAPGFFLHNEAGMVYLRKLFRKIKSLLQAFQTMILHYRKICTFLFWTSLLFVCSELSAQSNDPSDNSPIVMLMEIKAEIDPRMSRYVDLALSHAKEINAGYILIEMDTYGGALEAADDIRTAILNYPKPVFVFINKDAASAGALISIACDSIYMASGASIGAATVVTADGKAAPDKYQSYMRSIMRSTAEANGRNPNIAEAMVDENLEVDSISQIGQVITFSTSEAIKYGYCEGQVSSLEEILELNHIKDYRLERYELSTAEKIIALFLNPFISGILVLIIIGGIYFELQTPGVGFPILAAFIALVLYLTPYYLNGLAENWEIAVFFVGIALLLVEIFVIPGFGIAGISGLVLMVGALILVMLNNNLFDFSFVEGEEVLGAVAAVGLGLLGGMVLIFYGGIKFTDSNAFKKIALQGKFERTEGYTSNFKTATFVGKKGVTYTVLRPSGKILIDDEIYDAYTRGNYIDAGVEIIVVDETGTSLKVKEIV